AGTSATSSPFSVTSGGSFSLPAGQSQTITIRFAPSSAGAAGATLSVSTNGGNASVALTGAATSSPAPRLDVTPSSLDFGSVAAGSSKDVIATLKNGGGATLTISSVSAAAPFAVIGLPTPLTLAAG